MPNAFSTALPLRYALAVGFGLFAAALALALCLVLENAASRQIRSQIEDRLQIASSQMRDKLDRGMFERYRDVQIAASLHEVFDPAGPAVQQRAWLQRLKSTFPAYAWIGFADPAGHVVSSTGGLLEGVDVSARPWFGAARAQSFVGDVHDAKLLQKLLAPDAVEPLRFVDVSAPVFSPDGRLQGVLGAHISWSWAEEVRASVLTEGWRESGVELLVYSREGKLLLGGRDAPAQAPLSGGGLDLSAFAQDDLVQVSQSHGYHSYPGLGWLIVARQPVAAAFAPIATLRMQAIAVGAAVVVVFTLIGWLVASGVARPLERLARAASDIRRGSGEARVPTFAGRSEIAELARTLDKTFTSLLAGKAELALVNASLERQVERRTRDLVAARDEAEAATRAKSDFLATMSHELRTPLHGISGGAQLLRETGELTPGQARHVELIDAACASLLKVVGDVLDFSKLEAGKVELDPAPFSLAGLVETSVMIVRPTAAKKGLAIRAVVAPDAAPRVVGDETRLRQVLLNLLNNAVKFTAAGSVALTVRKTADAEGRETLRFEVVDTGIGITEQGRAKLFARFVQAEASTTRSHGGTGLGLAISKSLVEAMGGRIGVDSVLGEGSTFWFEAPLPEAAPEAQAQTARPVVPAPAAAGSLRILLAEDLLINQEIARVFLTMAGHEVEVVGNGAEAVAAVQTRDFDVVLMDVQMPVMDGVEAVRAIRAMGGPARETRVIAMTANVLAEQLALFASAGFDGHVGKPFRRDELLAAIELKDCERRAA